MRFLLHWIPYESAIGQQMNKLFRFMVAIAARDCMPLLHAKLNAHKWDSGSGECEYYV